LDNFNVVADDLTVADLPSLVSHAYYLLEVHL